MFDLASLRISYLYGIFCHTVLPHQRQYESSGQSRGTHARSPSALNEDAQLQSVDQASDLCCTASTTIVTLKMMSQSFGLGSCRISACNTRSSFRRASVTVSARPTCVATIKAPVAFCKTFYSGAGLSLLRPQLSSRPCGKCSRQVRVDCAICDRK